MSDSIPAQLHMSGKPPLSAADLWISVATLTLTVLVGALGAVGGMADAPGR